MALKTEDKAIGDTTYRVSQLGFSASRRTLVRLLKLGGPQLVQVGKGVVGDVKAASGGLEGVKDALGALDVAVVMDALGGLLDGLEDADLAHLAEVFGGQTQISPAGADRFIPLTEEMREIHFGGDGLLDFFRWLLFAVEVNYRGFFPVASKSPGTAPRVVAAG